jgi:hypothetical protein
VSQGWFNESQRPFATTLLGLANPLGLVLGQAVTPLIVTNSKDIPLMNLTWFALAVLGALLALAFVTRSRPPTPPSRSASLEFCAGKLDLSFWETLKKLSVNKAYIILVICAGEKQLKSGSFTKTFKKKKFTFLEFCPKKHPFGRETVLRFRKKDDVFQHK